MTKIVIFTIKFIFNWYRNCSSIFNSLQNYIIFKKNNVVLQYPKTTKIYGRIYIENKGRLEIGHTLLVKSGKEFNPIGAGHITRFIVKNGAKLCIGNNVGISNSTIFCTKNIKIGSNVLIGGNCKIWDTDFHSIDPKVRISGNDNQINSGPITIEDNVFIGGESIILKNISIGTNSIVGAGSVVTKNIPENEIWGGNPAKCIRVLKKDTE